MQIWRVGTDHGSHRWHWACHDRRYSKKENQCSDRGSISIETGGLLQGALEQVQCPGGIYILFCPCEACSRNRAIVADLSCRLEPMLRERDLEICEAYIQHLWVSECPLLSVLILWLYIVCFSGGRERFKIFFQWTVKLSNG